MSGGASDRAVWPELWFSVVSSREHHDCCPPECLRITSYHFHDNTSTEALLSHFAGKKPCSLERISDQHEVTGQKLGGRAAGM